jgi:redox-sensing transcriptional repressor
MPRQKKAIPSSVIKRLTKYLAYVQRLRAEEVEWVSSLELAETLGLTSSTVRQDLSHIDFSGTSKRGYETVGLEKSLTGVLGADTEWRMVVVGAGNLGRALALHEEFPRRGFHICGVFDSDPKVIGRRLGKLRVRDVRELAEAVTAEKADIGVIAVPARAAQGVADLLIASGVKGLLNLALTHVVAPKSVAVMDSRIVASLLELSHAIKFRR